MFKKTRKFLWSSFIGLILLCIVIFVSLGNIMSDKSKEAISEIGRLYMSEMNRQLQEKFVAITSLRLEQIEGIIRRTPPDTVSYGEEMLEDLATSAGVREFSFLGLYAEDGECETVYGDEIELFSEKEFQEMVRDKDKIITSGNDSAGNKVLVMCVAVKYPMKSGKTSIVMAAALPMQYLEEALVLDKEDNMVYSHIVRKDGTYVIRSGEGFRDNYFKRIKDIVENYNGKTSDDYALELQEAIESNSDYSALVMVDGTHQHLYCSPLPGAEWYLISVMPYGVLDDAINRLSGQRQYIMLAACAVILAAVLFIFVGYFKLSQQQLKQLDQAEKEAVRANKAKSEFLSNMSHDIRTPMNGIVGMTAIAMTNIHDPARIQDCLKKISMSSKHLLGLINDILDMSKI